MTGAWVTGTWDYEVATPRGTNGGTLVLTDSSEVLGGIINPDDGEATPLENVELSGDSLSCESPTDGYGTATMEIVFDGDSFEGGIRTWTSPGPSQCRERVRSRTFAALLSYSWGDIPTGNQRESRVGSCWADRHAVGARFNELNAEDLVLQLRLERIPVDVGGVCVGRVPTVGEHVLPLFVGRAHASVVGHNVEHETEPRLHRRLAQRLESLPPKALRTRLWSITS